MMWFKRNTGGDIEIPSPWVVQLKKRVEVIERRERLRAAEEDGNAAVVDDFAAGVNPHPDHRLVGFTDINDGSSLYIPEELVLRAANLVEKRQEARVKKAKAGK